VVQFYSDFKDFIKLLNKFKIRYLIIGGYAIAFHSRPRATQDIDIFIDNSEVNAKKILKALDEFGFASLNIKKEDLIKDDAIIQLGVRPLRIDLVTSIEGVKFDEAYKNRVTINYADLKNISLISIKDLIKNKKETGHEKDIFDIDWLNKYKNPNTNRNKND